MLCHERGNILKDRRSKARLNEQGVVCTVVCLYHAQIIYPSVTVEVQIVNHIPRGVEQLLKLAHRS